MLFSFFVCLSSPNSKVLQSLKPLQTFPGQLLMEERYGYFSQGSGGWRSMRDGDFHEEDVWAILKDRTDHSSSTSKVGKSKESPSISTSRRLPSAARMIPRANNSTQEAKIVQQSAPVNIPDWSKIYGKNSKGASEKGSWHDDDNNDDGFMNDGGDSDEDDDDDDYDSSKFPPHEWLARRLASSQISSFSVCEGVGRTLKGRDLSKVRNAVLTKTGFLE